MERARDRTGIRAILKRFRVFTEVPDRMVSGLADISQIKTFKRHERIWSEGDTCAFLYLVVEGRVKIIKHSETGKDVIVEIFGTGDAVGVTAAIVDRPYTTTAICLGPTQVVAVPRDEIMAVLSRVPDAAMRSLRGMAQRQRLLMQKIKELAAGGVEYRIAHLLLKLAERMGEKREGGIAIPVTLSRQDIADLVGTTLETAIRVMSRWRKMGVVENDARGIVIHDRELLEDLASGLMTRT